MKNTATVKVINNEIVASKTFLTKAQNYGSREYEILKQVRKDFPNANIRVKKIKKNPEKETYKNLTYKKMEEFFETTDNYNKYMSEYLIIRKRSKIQRSPYKYVLNWFVSRFPEYKASNIFDDEAEYSFEIEQTNSNTSMMAD